MENQRLHHTTRYFFYYLVLFTILTYPLFYFAYKYNLPKFGSTDIYQFVRMYINPLQFSVSESPFNSRQISAVLVYIITEIGIYYDADISFNDPNFPQNIYFAAILVNWLAVLVGGAMLSAYYVKKNPTQIAFLLAGLPSIFLFFQFSVIFHALSESTDGVSVCLAILCFIAYTEKNIYIFALLLLFSIFQRELILVMFTALSLYEILRTCIGRHKLDRKMLLMFLVSLMTCLLYLVIRIFYLSVDSKAHSNQISISDSLQFLYNFHWNMDLFFQVILTQNTFLFTIIIFGYVCFSGLPSRNRILFADFEKVVVVTVVLFLFGIAAGIGNNIGRILMFSSPLYMTLLFRCLTVLYDKTLLDK